MHDGGPDLGTRDKHVRGDVEAFPDGRMDTDDHGKDPVLLVSRCRENALRHFPLHHEDRVADDLLLLKQTEENLARDVVREISDDAQRARPAACERVKIHAQDVLMQKLHIGLPGSGKALPKDFHRARVDIDGRQRDVFLRKKGGQHTGTRTDFQDMITFTGRERLHDIAGDIPVMQEMLSQTLFRMIRCLAHGIRYKFPVHPRSLRMRRETSTLINRNNRFVHKTHSMEHIPDHFRCGYVALVGAPNAGKSTLMNTMLGMKISIVTAKPQTTRKRVLGFHTGEAHQMIFIDTPGLIKPKYELQESMVKAAHSAIAEADACCHLIDAPRILESERAFPEGLFDLFRESGRPVIAVLNKVDLVRNKRDLLPLMEKTLQAYPFKEVVPISALEGEAVPDLVAALEKLLPLGPPLYPPDMLSDQPERFFVSEIVREKIFEQFRQEVPYATEVYISEYREEEERDYIAAEIIVERESQKRIIIGAKGAAIKRIGMAAREDIEVFLDRRVFLDLHVRIREGWRDNAAWIRRFGY